jgi:hypothetical protein
MDESGRIAFLWRSVWSNHKHIFYSCSFLVAVFIFTFPRISKPVTIGLDPSYEFALNYFFSNKIPIGKEIIFTYGPLGFLMFPQPIGSNLVISVIIISVLKLGFLISFLYLIFLIKKPIAWFDKIGIWVVFSVNSFLISFRFIGFGFLLVFLTATLLLLHGETRKSIFFILGITISTLAILVKSSYGIVSFLMVFSYGLIEYLRFKHGKSLLFTLLGMAGSFLLGWFVIYGNLEGIGDYLHGMFELASGNSSAMTTNPDNNWFLLSIFVLSYFSVPFYIREKRMLILYGVFLLPFFAFFKYAFSREINIHHFFFFIIHFYGLVFCCSKEFNVKASLIILISLVAFFGNMAYAKQWEWWQGHRPDLNPIRRLHYFWVNVLNLQRYEKVLLERSRENLRDNVLDENILQKIRYESVDTYPWETAYIFANNLNWKPRPVFQSYAAYTPWLDMKNSIFWDSYKSPKYIIWELEHWGSEVSSIDGRYLFNDEPLTIYEILNHYRLIHRDKKIALLERSITNRLKEPKLIASENGHWSEWIKVPPLKNGIIRARIDVSRRIIGSLKRLLYKEEEFFIEYKLDNGDVKKYRLTIDNAVSGVWISPLIVKISNPFWGLVVKEIRLSHSKSDFLERKIRIEWEFIEASNNEAFFE